MGWRQSSNLDLKFEGAQVVTDDSGFRVWTGSDAILQNSEVLVLGPSSAFGWGVEARDTYSSVLQNISKLRVFNAGQIGFGIKQGQILWKKIQEKRTHPFKYVIISYGVNDIDRFRFYGNSELSDIEYFNSNFKNEPTVFEKINFNSSFYNLLTRAISEVQMLWPCPPETELSLRLPISQWALELDKLSEDIKKTGAQPILLTSPFLFSNPIKNSDNLGGESDKYYKLSAVEARNSYCSKSRQYLIKAKGYEPYRIKRDVEKINTQTIQLGVKWSVVSVHEQLIDKNDFVDPIHPSKLGHEKIAHALYNVIRE